MAGVVAPVTGAVVRPLGPALAPVGSALAPVGSVLAPVGSALAPVTGAVGGLVPPVVSGGLLPLPGPGTGSRAGPGTDGPAATSTGLAATAPAATAPAASLTNPARPAADGASSPAARSTRSWPALTGAVSLPGFPASAELPAGGPDPLSTSSGAGLALAALAAALLLLGLPGRGRARLDRSDVSRAPTSRPSLPPSDLGRRASRPRTRYQGELQVNLWMKRAIGAAALGGGLLALSAGAASAQDVSADVSANLGRSTSAEVRVCADGRVLSGLLGSCGGSGTSGTVRRARARVPRAAQADVSIGTRRSRSTAPRPRSTRSDADASAATSPRPRADASASLTRRAGRLYDLDLTASLAGIGLLGSSPFTLTGDPATDNLLPTGELTLDGLSGEAPAGIGVLDTGPIASATRSAWTSATSPVGPGDHLRQRRGCPR